MNGEAVPFEGFRHFQAPRGDGDAFIDPPFTQMAEAIDANRRLITYWDFTVAGVPIHVLRRQGSDELVRAALQYTSSYMPSLSGSEHGFGARNANGQSPSDLTFAPNVDGTHEILLSGHQPQLFHPGVWLKNFALSKLASERQALGINLVVDNDLCGTPSVRTLGYRRDVWQLGSVDYDAPTQLSVPYEQRTIEDWDRFESFGQRLSEEISGWSQSAAIGPLWPLVIEAGKRTGNIGLAIAQGRHLLEQRLGLRTLEVPLSHLAQTQAFFALMLAVFQDLPRFQTCYNESLVEYRSAHRIRSAAHPVPALAHEGAWWETPFWVYGDRDPRRRPLWMKVEGEGIFLSDRVERAWSLPSPLSLDSLWSQWKAERNRDFKVRPRALMTTMAARLIFGDYFLHGIGGAKYDQLGDRIVTRFFGIQPPSYGVISGTVQLPISQASALIVRSPEAIQGDLRDTFFSPERFIDNEALAHSVMLRDEKHQLIQSIPPRGKRYSWHQRISAINHQLSDSLEPLRHSLKGELVQAREQMQRSQWLHSREWSFALYPLAHLIERFRRMLA